jgi:membrane-associated phospholipid phosphatase
LPQANDPRWLARMDGWARAQVVRAELLADTVMVPGPAVDLAHRAANGGAIPICKIQRPSKTQFRQQMRLVETWANARMERLPEIMTQVDSPYGYWSSLLNLHPEFSRATLELMENALAFCSSVLQRMKFALVCPRPTDYSSRTQPVIVARGFFAFPSGHATEAFMMARLLALLMKAPASSMTEQQLQQLAARVATNRVVAGVHFPVDGVAGRALGESLAEYLAYRAGRSAGWASRTFDAGKADLTALDLDLAVPIAPGAALPAYYGAKPETSAAPATPSSWTWLWDRAAVEWQ